MKLSKIVAASTLLFATLPAFAATAFFDFSDLEYAKGKNTGLLPSEPSGGYFACTGADLCSSNVDNKKAALGGDLKYTVNGITATATGQYFSQNKWTTASVVQDSENGHNFAKQIGAGLGVYHTSGDSSDDNITNKEKLVLSFAGPVKLDAAFLRSDGHDTAWKKDATLLLNGVEYKLAGSLLPQNMVGSVFTFEFGGKKADQFYLGGMTVSAVPEPSSYAMLLGGIGLMGLIARRRKQQA